LFAITKPLQSLENPRCSAEGRFINRLDLLQRRGALSNIHRLPYLSYFPSQISSVFIYEKGCRLSNPQRILFVMKLPLLKLRNPSQKTRPHLHGRGNHRE
jgi:hypothetical protein